jgi:hypothetical protein
VLTFFHPKITSITCVPKVTTHQDNIGALLLLQSYFLLHYNKNPKFTHTHTQKIFHSLPKHHDSLYTQKTPFIQIIHFHK